MDRITDYTTLVTAVQELVDLDIGDAVDGFIQMTEQDIGRRLDTNWQEYTESAAVLVAGVVFKDDHRGILRVRIGNDPLEYMHRDVAEATWGSANSGLPVAYSVTGVSANETATPGSAPQQLLEFWPTPPDDLSYTAEITYKLAVPPLTVGEPLNWVLTVAPDAYLYGAARHAVVFNGDDTSAAAYTSEYDRAVAGVLAEADRYHSLQRTNSPPGAGGYEFWLP